MQIMIKIIKNNNIQNNFTSRVITITNKVLNMMVMVVIDMVMVFVVE